MRHTCFQVVFQSDELLRRQSCILHTRRAYSFRTNRADDWIRTLGSAAGGPVEVHRRMALEALSEHDGDLHLDGLTSLPDCLAEALSKQTYLYLNGLTNLTHGAANALSKHVGPLQLNGIASLSDDVAEALSRHKGGLKLDGLTCLSDAAALAFSNQDGDLTLCGLTNLSVMAASSLGRRVSELEVDLDKWPKSAADAYCAIREQGESPDDEKGRNP